MQTKFDIKDRVEPRNVQFVVQGIRVYADGYTTYDIAIMDEDGGDPLGNCVVGENKIEKFFAKGAKLL